MLKKPNQQAAAGCLSDKDIQLIRKTYSKLTEIYYQNPQNQSVVADIINLGHLILQTVKTKRQADALALVSIVQTLKVKSKSRPEVLAHIDATVRHLKNPSENLLKQQTLMHCLQKSDLFIVGCTVGIRFYQKIHSNSSEFNFKDIIGEISRNIAVSPTLCIELVFEICRENELNSRHAVKSGVIKYVFLSYITQTLENKFNLYKAIKLLKVVSGAQNSLIREKQKSLALVIYNYEDYIPVIEGIIGKCYDSDYCETVGHNKLDLNVLDQLYLWSYLEIFSVKHLNEQIISQLFKMISGQLDQAVQTKAYGILANFSKFRKVVLKDGLVVLPKSQRALLNYIKLCVNCCQIEPSSITLINMGKLLVLVDKSPNPKTSNLFKYLKELGSKQHKIGVLSQNIKKMFDMEKNADFMMERASKIPQNNEQLTDIRQILKEKDRSNQFESDTLRAVKERALQSLHTAVIQKKKLDFNPVLKEIDLGDIRLLAKLLQILELHLTMNDELIDSIDAGRVVEIIQWIQDNYKGEMVQWGSISQLLIILHNDDEWKVHLKELHSKAFWLLNIQNLQGADLDLIFKKLSEIPPQSAAKIPLLIGFLSRSLNPTQKVNLNKSFSSYFQLMINNIKNISGSSYKINLLMLASFIKNWQAEESSQVDKTNNEFFRYLIDRIIKHVLNNFRSLEQQYELLQNCIPYNFNCDTLSDNLDYVVCLYGRLASYIYRSNNEKGNKVAISYDRIKAISKVSYEKSRSILQILKFLQNNSHILQSDELSVLLQNFFRKKNVYWHLYPNFYSIFNLIISILGKTTNPVLTNNISGLLYKILAFIHQNQDISDAEYDDLMKEIKNLLQLLVSKNMSIDKELLQKGIDLIKDKDVRTQFETILAQFKAVEIKQQVEKLPTNQSTISTPTESTINNIISNIIPYPQNRQSKVEPSGNQQKQKEGQSTEVNLNHLDDNSTATNEHQMQVLEALRLLKKIVNKQQPIQIFPKLVAVFNKFTINTQHTDILGHLLAMFYPQKPQLMQEEAIALLLNKQKTRLSKQGCFNLMSQYSETFCLSRRWKLIGKEWLDLAMLRFSEGFYADASQVAEHNLPRTADLEHFYTQKYHQTVANLFSKIEKEEDFLQLLILIGTSARHNQIKMIYFRQKLHIKILQSITKYPQTPKLIANISYALSSLVYMQPQVCIDLIKLRQEMQLLINSFKSKVENKSIIQSGACLIANLSFSNEEVKEALRQLNVIEIFLFLFQNTLDSPEISTFKQILRAFGNLSLSLKCTQELIDQHFCALATRMAQKINIFVNFDEKKAALMKISIDLIANLASHRYKLQNFHKQKLTELIITLLETTQNNLPILTACIDTIDCLCQNSEIENYVVVERKIPYLLIDILKIQTDQKIVVKSTRLLTNLTINAACIPHILEANLLNVLANIVMPHFYGNKVAAEQNKKMETYILKILTRIFASKPQKYTILKSGYLDCLIRTIQTTQNIEDSYIEILYQYSEIMPSFLNKRAFISLIRVLTKKNHIKEIANKCLITIKKLSSFYERDEEDIFISGTIEMYQKILTSELKEQGLLLLCYHLLRSDKLRIQIRKKLSKVHQIIRKYAEDSKYVDICKQIQFLINNPYQSIEVDEEMSHQKEYDQLKKGFKCNLYRIDGSFKKAIIDMNEQYQIRVYKFPDGEIKKKYVADIKNIKDFQFNYPVTDQLWNSTIFSLEKGIFDSKKCNPKNCATMVGYARWGEISYINVEFESEGEKMRCYHCICTIFNSLN